MMFDKLFSMFTGKKATPVKPKRTSKTVSKKPKPDPTRIGGLGEYKIDIQLSQLPKPAKYLNDLMLSNPHSKSGYSQIDHLLVTAYGIFVIETKNYSGTIKGRKQDKQWRVNGKFPMYNPLRQNYGHIEAVKSVLRVYPSMKFVSVVTFTRRCILKIDSELRQPSSDQMVIFDTELTEIIQRKLVRLKIESQTPALDEPTIQNVVELLTAANITDPSIRAEHIKKVKPNQK